MTGWKLFRVRKDGTLGPLFVGRSQVIELGVWYLARTDLPTQGLAYRPGFHCCPHPIAPHLKLKLSNGERRVWCKVEVEGVQEYKRPQSQGGWWWLCQHMKVITRDK